MLEALRKLWELHKLRELGNLAPIPLPPNVLDVDRRKRELLEDNAARSVSFRRPLPGEPLVGITETWAACPIVILADPDDLCGLCFSLEEARAFAEEILHTAAFLESTR